ncbi:MAG: sulfotransferase [Desulfocapsa sp.]|nr:sulfotransferase [Desulfocapsa sp.]
MSLRKLKRSRKQSKKKSDPAAAENSFAKGNMHKQAGRPVEAEACFRHALRLNPNHGECCNNLGNLLHGQGKIADALPYYKRSCELMPDNPVCHYNYGTCLYETGQHLESAEVLERVVHMAPNYLEAFTSLGRAYQTLGDPGRAITAFKKALRLNPDSAEAYRFLGLALKDEGKMTEALEKFELALRIKPDDACTWYNTTRCRRYQSADDRDIQSMERLLQKNTKSVEDTIFLHFGLGKIYDDLRIFDKAFDHFQQGNSLKRDSLGSAWISTGIELTQIRKTFQQELFNRFGSAGERSELPVFIVGMPRSGTSLVEQICASHSRVQGRGELKHISSIKDSLVEAAVDKSPYPECLLSVNSSLLHSLGQQYIREISTNLPENISRVTDKMPSNFILLGLIRIILPNARIIHCTRNPVDTCLSNYFQYFNEGNECSFDLDTLALYYRKYKELMAFWKQTLPGTLHEVNYEELVDDPEKNCRKLINFLGLEWEESCLSFFETKRAVRTASDWQVRQPIYTSSVERWRNYEEWLGKLLDGLASDSRLV